MTKVALSQTAQGFNDVYWCEDRNKAVIVNDGMCPACRKAGIKPPERPEYAFGHLYLAHVHKGWELHNGMEVIAEHVKGADDAEEEIEILRKAISGFGQQVHQAYHGAQPPDLSDVNHLECPRGFCRSVQHVLDPKRSRGMP